MCGEEFPCGGGGLGVGEVGDDVVEIASGGAGAALGGNEIELRLFEEPLGVEFGGVGYELLQVVGERMVRLVGEDEIGLAEGGARLGAVAVGAAGQLAEEEGQLGARVPVA